MPVGTRPSATNSHDVAQADGTSLQRLVRAGSIRLMHLLCATVFAWLALALATPSSARAALNCPGGGQQASFYAVSLIEGPPSSCDNSGATYPQLFMGLARRAGVASPFELYIDVGVDVTPTLDQGSDGSASLLATTSLLPSAAGFAICGSPTRARATPSTTLTGDWRLGAWKLRPSATIAYMEDQAQSYADSFGVNIPSVTARLGQAKAGPMISYMLPVSPDLVIEPRVGAQVIWNFAGDARAEDFGILAGAAAGPQGARGRAEIGLKAQTSDGIALDLSGSYDGIGSSSFSAVTGRAAVRVPFN